MLHFWWDNGHEIQGSHNESTLKIKVEKKQYFSKEYTKDWSHKNNEIIFCNYYFFYILLFISISFLCSCFQAIDQQLFKINQMKSKKIYMSGDINKEEEENSLWISVFLFIFFFWLHRFFFCLSMEGRDGTIFFCFYFCFFYFYFKHLFTLWIHLWSIFVPVIMCQTVRNFTMSSLFYFVFSLFLYSFFLLLLLNNATLAY